MPFDYPKLQNHSFSSVAQSCPTLCDPMDCSTPGFAVCPQILELAQTHVHCVGGAVQPSHPLPSPSPPAFNISHVRVFSGKSVLCIRWPNIGVSASTLVLLMSIQDWFPWGLTSLISLQSKGLSRVFSNTTVQNCQFFSTQLYLWHILHLTL